MSNNIALINITFQVNKNQEQNQDIIISEHFIYVIKQIDTTLRQFILLTSSIRRKNNYTIIQINIIHIAVQLYKTLYSQLQ